MLTYISSGAAKVLRAMIVSCGSSGCFEAVRDLANVDEKVSIEEIGLDKSGNWKMAVFQRLLWYAREEKIEEFSTFDMVCYFAGNLHIEIMSRISDHAGLGEYLGKDIGLVTHVLLPLEGDVYNNAGYSVRFKKAVEVNPKEKGYPCYHLGLIVNVDITQDQVARIKKIQAKNKDFVFALSKIKGAVSPPDEYFKALNCTFISASKNSS